MNYVFETLIELRDYFKCLLNLLMPGKETAHKSTLYIKQQGPHIGIATILVFRTTNLRKYQ